MQNPIMKYFEYRLLYELTMQRGVSMADTIRQIIREAASAKHQKTAGPET